MKQKTSIFFALLFIATMAFSFGIATTAQADACCDYGIPFPGCQQSKGHYVGSSCVLNYSDPCDALGTCQ